MAVINKTKVNMTSMERVLTALSHKEADRVPLFLLLSLYGAKEMGIGIKKYFSQSGNVVSMQEYMQKKYHNDCFYAFFYAGIEVEAAGGEIIYADDCPPNTGRPIMKTDADILTFNHPVISQSSCLKKVLTVIETLKKNNGGRVPIIGVVMSPFSLPVMQLGFDRYLDIMHEQPQLFEHLMKINEEFCVEWANAQLKAGATAICYFDPVSSSSIIPPQLYEKLGFAVAKRTIARIKGPTATHMASGRVLPIIDQIAHTGTAVMGVSAIEDLAQVKEKSKGRLSVIGNLNGIEMCNWNIAETRAKVRNIIETCASGGGLIISDSHGEIPYQVKEETLLAIADTIKEYGVYPIKQQGWV